MAEGFTKPSKTGSDSEDDASLQELKQELEGIQDEIRRARKKQDKEKMLRKEIEAAKQELATITGEEPTFQTRLVYFNAKMMQHKTMNEGITFIFETVTENEGAGYDSHTGIFRAPEPGLYFFSVTVATKEKSKNAHPVLFKNGVEIGRTFAGSNASDWPKCGSFSKLTYLNKDDQVYVKEIELKGYTANVNGNGFTSFRWWTCFVYTADINRLINVKTSDHRRCDFMTKIL